MNAATSIDLPEIDPATRAAVMVMLLDEAQASQILAGLDPAELRALGEKMCALDDVGPLMIHQAVTDFLHLCEGNGLPADQRIAQVQGLMTGAVGEDRARSVMEAILPPAARKPKAIDVARWLNPEALLPLVEGEHPQAIAVLLVQLDPQVAARVLASLPEDQQGEVVHRVATLGAISAESLVMLEALLARRIADSHGSQLLELGGPADAAAIINKSAGPVEKRVMARIARIDRALARKIESEMFRFEHLFVLDNQSMGTLLREVDSLVLVDALKGIEPDKRNCFFASMSSRAADGVRDEIDNRGRLKAAEVESAQQVMIDTARRLAAEGSIQFGNSGDDEYV